MKFLLVVAAIILAVALTRGSHHGDEIDEALKTFGYIKGKSSAEDRKNAIKKFQKMAGIEETGMMTNETIAYIHKARCGDHDDKTTNVTRRYNLANTKWKKNVLQYCIFNDPKNSPTMNHMNVRRAIYDGLKAWEPFIPIKFKEIGECRGADFFFSFGKEQHANWDVDAHKRNGNCYYGNTFNSNGGVLAHAFFPTNGNLHFDDNEEWTEGTDKGINMRIVTIHEMGHALGLHHSDVSGAIMLPFYGGYIPYHDFKMPQDEIDAVGELYYGRKPKRSAKRQAENTMAVCKAKHLDAVFDFPDGFTYIVADGVLYRRNEDGMDKGFQKKIGKMWQGAIKKPRASVFVPQTKTLYLFRGRKVSFAKYTGQDIDQLKFTTVKITKDKGNAFSGEEGAAFGSGSDNFIYLVEGEFLHKFNLAENKIVGKQGFFKDVIHPDAAARYPPVIDGAYVSLGSNGKEVFFFTGLSYFKGTKKDDKYFISADYPKPFLKEYLKC